MHYHYTDNHGVESLAVVLQNDQGGVDATTITSEHPNFDAIMSHIRSYPEPDPAWVRRLLDFSAEAREQLRRLSSRIAYQHGAIYFDGDRIDTSLTRHIVRMLRDGDHDYQRFVRFLENLAANPSQLSRMHLYRWLQDRDFTITEDGCFIGYKGVQDSPDNHSVHSGRATVDGQVHVGPIPNPIGAVVEMPRSSVNPNRGEGCSTGLHVGTWAYASGFGRKTLTVSVNPRDVVSVPRDCDSQKLRTCRYKVLAAAEACHDGTAYDPGDEADADFLIA